MKNRDIEKLSSSAIEVAINAGKKLVAMQKSLQKLEVRTKKAQGVVSKADLASEAFIIKSLQKLYPQDEILAEEMAHRLQISWEKKHSSTFPEWMWVIDPLDGTSNYLNGMDYYAVCISLLYNGSPFLGVVHRPRTFETFSAVKGQGHMVYLDQKQKKKVILSGKNQKTLKESLLVTGFVSEKGKAFDDEFDYFKNMMKKSRGIRRMGSAALDICYVALGVFDGFWERGLAPWDVAAAGLIAKESGVKVTNYFNGKFCPFDNSILVSRPPLHSKILREIKKFLH